MIFMTPGHEDILASAARLACQGKRQARADKQSPAAKAGNIWLAAIFKIRAWLASVLKSLFRIRSRH